MRLSLDDFGTGWSSLRLLRELPLSEIKIDRSFVSRAAVVEEDAVVVRATTRLAHGLGMHVVAEGIETAVAWQAIKDMNCDTAQGWHLARPMPGARGDRVAVRAAAGKGPGRPPLDWRPCPNHPPHPRLPPAVPTAASSGESAALSREDVAHLARLARIEATDDELDRLVGQLDVILESVARVGEVAADDVPPTSHPLPLTNVTRPDEPVPSLTPQEALSGAPDSRASRFRVPRILEED